MPDLIRKHMIEVVFFIDFLCYQNKYKIIQFNMEDNCSTLKDKFFRQKCDSFLLHIPVVF